MPEPKLDFHVSINSKDENLEEFSKRLKRLHEHFQFYKGDYSGNYNTSALVIHLLTEKYEELFGNNNIIPNTPLFNREELSKIIHERFNSNLHRYRGNVQLIKDLKVFAFDLLDKAENQIRLERNK